MLSYDRDSDWNVIREWFKYVFFLESTVQFQTKVRIYQKSQDSTLPDPPMAF